MTAIFITGAGKRIGRAIAIAAAREGYDIAVHYNTSPDAAEAVAADIKNLGRQAAIIQADLADESAVIGLIVQASKALGKPITGLSYNASLFVDDDWDSGAGTTWDRHMAINLRAPYLLSRDLRKNLPVSMAGVIINIIDQRVWRLNPSFFSYTISKSALWTMTKTLAQALAPDIRVNGVGPGPVLQSIHQDSAAFSTEAENTPLGVSVDPEEIAAACLYLLKAEKVTGQMIAVDSGQHLSWKTPDVVHD